MVKIRPNFQLLVQKRDKEDGGNLSQVLSGSIEGKINILL